LHQSHPSWFAVFTKPRQEHVALENLHRQGFQCFLPMAINPYQRRTVRKPRVEPLFPRYLFLHAIADQQSLGPVRSTRGVNNLVRFGMELAHIPEKIIRAIRNRCDPDTGLVCLEPVTVRPGDKVRVFDGPLAGAEGLFKACTGEQRALLLIELMGRQTSVEVNRLMLQKVG
jgi:transcriptional antiterminator RfaH